MSTNNSQYIESLYNDQGFIDARVILQTLPHRYPILLVDRVLDLEFGKYCKGIKNVTINEPFFQGHYPGMPVMPGVLIIEAIAQVSGLILLSDPSYHGLVPLLGAIDNVKFKRQVIPGDQLIIDTKLEWYRNNIGKLSGHATVDGQLAAPAEIMFKLVPREGMGA